VDDTRVRLRTGYSLWIGRDRLYASPVTSSPAVATGKVVVATADGQVICFG
jgi:hypothetical protein